MEIMYDGDKRKIIKELTINIKSDIIVISVNTEIKYLGVEDEQYERESRNPAETRRSWNNAK